MRRLFGVLLVWLILICIGSEVAARVYVASVFHSPLPANMTANHNAPSHRVTMPDDLQSVHNPLSLAANFRGVSENGIVYETNELGFRDDPLDPLATHWVFLGDSTTFGLNLAHENTYPELVEQMALTDGRDVQSINTGVPGRGTANEYDVLANLLGDTGIRPEYVIVGFFMNDVRDDYFYQQPQRPLPDLLQQSVFLRLLYGFREVSTAQWEAVKADTSTGDRTSPEWQTTLANLARLQTLAETSGATFVLLYIPYAESEALTGQSLIADVLAEYARQHGTLFVNGVTVYADYLNGATILPQGFYSSPGDMGHPGVLSSQLLAQAVYEAIIQ